MHLHVEARRKAVGTEAGAEARKPSGSHLEGVPEDRRKEGCNSQEGRYVYVGRPAQSRRKAVGRQGKSVG